MFSPAQQIRINRAAGVAGISTPLALSNHHQQFWQPHSAPVFNYQRFFPVLTFAPATLTGERDEGLWVVIEGERSKAGHR